MEELIRDEDRELIHKMIMMQHKHIEKHGKSIKMMRMRWDKVGLAGYTVEWKYFENGKPKK